jgi:hypothetical protein
MHAHDGSAHFEHALFRFVIDLFKVDEPLADADRRAQRVHRLKSKANIQKKIKKNL